MKAVPVISKNQKKSEIKKPEDEKKIRLLMLHGYFQSGTILSKKTGAFRKIFKNIDFVYPTAPSQMEADFFEDSEKEEDTGPKFKWWSAKAEDYLTTKHYDGAEKSIEFIKDYFRTEGPFDGILGFSQGAVFASILCALNTKEPTTENPISFKFAILASGFAPSASPYRELLIEAKDRLPPTLHIYGNKDPRVDPSDSKKLLDFFPNAELLVHDGGHYIPSNAASKDVLRKFIENSSK